MDWKLTNAAIADGIPNRDGTDGEDLSLGYAYMRALVQEYDRAQELGEGVLFFAKPARDYGKWI